MKATQLYGPCSLQLRPNFFMYSQCMKYIQDPSTAETQPSRMEYSCCSESNCTGAVKLFSKINTFKIIFKKIQGRVCVAGVIPFPSLNLKKNLKWHLDAHKDKISSQKVPPHSQGEQISRAGG